MASLLIALFATGRSFYISHKKKRDEKRNRLSGIETAAKSSSGVRRGRTARETPSTDGRRSERASRRNPSRTGEDDGRRLSEQSTLAGEEAYAAG